MGNEGSQHVAEDLWARVALFLKSSQVRSCLAAVRLRSSQCAHIYGRMCKPLLERSQLPPRDAVATEVGEARRAFWALQCRFCERCFRQRSCTRNRCRQCPPLPPGQPQLTVDLCCRCSADIIPAPRNAIKLMRRHAKRLQKLTYFLSSRAPKFRAGACPELPKPGDLGLDYGGIYAHQGRFEADERAYWHQSRLVDKFLEKHLWTYIGVCHPRLVDRLHRFDMPLPQETFLYSPSELLTAKRYAAKGVVRAKWGSDSGSRLTSAGKTELRASFDFRECLRDVLLTRLHNVMETTRAEEVNHILQAADIMHYEFETLNLFLERLEAFRAPGFFLDVASQCVAEASRAIKSAPGVLKAVSGELIVGYCLTAFFHVFLGRPLIGEIAQVEEPTYQLVYKIVGQFVIRRLGLPYVYACLQGEKQLRERLAQRGSGAALTALEYSYREDLLNKYQQFLSVAGREKGRSACGYDGLSLLRVWCGDPEVLQTMASSVKAPFAEAAVICRQEFYKIVFDLSVVDPNRATLVQRMKEQFIQPSEPTGTPNINLMSLALLNPLEFHKEQSQRPVVLDESQPGSPQPRPSADEGSDNAQEGIKAPIGNQKAGLRPIASEVVTISEDEAAPVVPAEASAKPKSKNKVGRPKKKPEASRESPRPQIPEPRSGRSDESPTRQKPRAKRKRSGLPDA